LAQVELAHEKGTGICVSGLTLSKPATADQDLLVPPSISVESIQHFGKAESRHYGDWFPEEIELLSSARSNYLWKHLVDLTTTLSKNPRKSIVDLDITIERLSQTEIQDSPKQRIYSDIRRRLRAIKKTRIKSRPKKFDRISEILENVAEADKMAAKHNLEPVEVEEMPGLGVQKLFRVK